MASETCCKTMWKGSTWHRKPVACGKPSKVERDGKHYCGIHDPKKAEDRDAAYKAKLERDRKESLLSKAAPELYAVVANMIADEDFASLCAAMGEEPEWLKAGRRAALKARGETT